MVCAPIRATIWSSVNPISANRATILATESVGCDSKPVGLAVPLKSFRPMKNGIARGEPGQTAMARVAASFLKISCGRSGN